MSSVIVLDSSESEDEGPPGKKSRSAFPTTATAAKTSTINNKQNARAPPTSTQTAANANKTPQKAPIVLQPISNPVTLRSILNHKTPTPAQHLNTATTLQAAGGLHISNVTTSAPTPVQLFASPLAQGTSVLPDTITTDHILPKSTVLRPVTTLASTVVPNKKVPNFKRLFSPAVMTSATTSPASLSSPNMQGASANVTKTGVRRVQPTTVLRNNDEAWLQRKKPTSPTSYSLFSSSLPLQPMMSVAPATITSPKSMISLSPNSLMSASPSSQSSPDACMPSTSKQATLGRHTPDMANGDSTSSREKSAKEDESKIEPPPLEPEYEEFLKACRKAESSKDMEKLIDKKLLKYYYAVPTEFVKSKGFRKSLRKATENIQAQPHFVYNHVLPIVEELDARRKTSVVVMQQEESQEDTNSTTTSTGNKHTDEQIKKLNKALYILSKRIDKLEQAEVDLDDDDSPYLQLERFKKRACMIYNKICDLTGETKDAQRLASKPLKFSGTDYPQFNKTLSSYINRTKEFPDYCDVLRTLEHCNEQYGFGLVNFQIKRIAHEAFLKVGKLLQYRRKTDLYEMVTHFTGHAKDPATTDPELSAKLNENQKYSKKIGEIIEKYAREQDLTPEEQKQAREMEEKAKVTQRIDASKEGDAEDAVPSAEPDDAEEDEDDGDGEEEEEEEDKEDKINLDEEVEKYANGHLSDGDADDSDVEFHEEIGLSGPVEVDFDSSPLLVELRPQERNNNNTIKDKTVKGPTPPLNGKIASATTPECGLKIVSVSSIGEKPVLDSETPAPPRQPSNITSSTTQAKQKTVAEIVISDEEEL